jgi:hypothetical protein
VENRLSLGVETRKSAKRIGKTKQNNKGSETYKKVQVKAKRNELKRKVLSPRSKQVLYFAAKFEISPSQNY